MRLINNWQVYRTDPNREVLMVVFPDERLFSFQTNRGLVSSVSMNTSYTDQSIVLPDRLLINYLVLYNDNKHIPYIFLHIT